MSEAMIDWLVQNLGGRIGKEFYRIYHFHDTDP